MCSKQQSDLEYTCIAKGQGEISPVQATAGEREDPTAR